MAGKRSIYFSDGRLLNLLYLELSYEAIAARLCVAPTTVAAHAARLRKEGRFPGRTRGRNWKAYRESRRAVLESLCARGSTYAEIGKALGLDTSSAYNACKRLGCKTINGRGPRAER